MTQSPNDNNRGMHPVLNPSNPRTILGVNTFSREDGEHILRKIDQFDQSNRY